MATNPAQPAPVSTGVTRPDSAPPKYRNMPRNRGAVRTLFYVETERTLMAEDHLLISTKRAYSEKNRKIHFADIQSMSIESTADARLRTFAFILQAIWIIVTAATIEYFGDAPSGVFFIVGGACLLIPILGVTINLISGPTAQLRITSAVQSATLRSVRRLRTATKWVAMVRPYADASQGGAVTSAHAFNPNLPPPRAGAHAEAVQLKEPISRRALKPYWIAYGLIVTVSISSFADLLISSTAKSIVDGLLSIGIFIPLIWMIISTRKYSMLPALERFTFTSFIILIVMFIVSGSVGVGYVLGNLESGGSVFEIDTSTPFLRASTIITGSFMLFFGLYGLLLTREQSNEIRATEVRGSIIAHEKGMASL